MADIRINVVIKTTSEKKEKQFCALRMQVGKRLQILLPAALSIGLIYKSLKSFCETGTGMPS